jgi:hypothetical protein
MDSQGGIAGFSIPHRWGDENELYLGRFSVDCWYRFRALIISLRRLRHNKRRFA